MQNQQIRFELLKVQQERARRLARSSMLTFTKYTNDEYRPNWHHRILCDYLDKFVSGEIRRLMVFMPPRHGKSELVSRRLPAYLMGRNPKAQIIACSYSADLASSMNRDVQRIMDSTAYAELFPGSRLNASNIRTTSQGQHLRNSDIFEIVGTGGVYLSAGVGGGITGRGANYAIIDDPVKNQQDADSPTMRQNVWDWYTSTLYTRLQHPRSILLTLTRWHEDDLAGRLLKQAADNNEADQWTILKLPARYELDDRHHLDPRKEGESLWESDFGNDVLKGIQASVGSRVWNALYQQRPSAMAGNIVQRDWWKFYREKPANFDYYALSADLTFKDGEKSDFAVFQIWGKRGAERYLLDQVRSRMGFNEQLAVFRNLCSKWPMLNIKLIEDAANGAALVSLLQKEIPGIVAVRPEGSKTARAEAVAPQIEAGNVFLPDPSICSWVNDYIEEWINFPNGMNDDQVDATSQALQRFGNSAPMDWMPVSITGENKFNW